MFGIEALDVVIGMIFIYLLFSLLVSILNELISTLFSLKGKKLYSAISQFLNSDDFKKLQEDPRIQLLLKEKTTPQNTQPVTKYNFPDIIPEELFAEILYDHREHLSSFAKTKIKTSKAELLKHYDLIILQAKKTYKKNIQIVVLILSFIVSFGFNVDSISIFQELSNNPEKAAAIANSAAQYIVLNDSLDFSASDSTSIDSLMLDIKHLNDDQIKSINSNLGSIGWDLNTPFWNQLSWLVFAGWLISALALSLGAPFWFDLLKKVINIKEEISKGDQKNEKDK